MSRPRLALADIFRQHGPDYRARHPLPRPHLRVMRAIETCRTAALGGHVETCGQCDHQRIAYNSCRNRLLFHPRLHAVVTGGGISACGQRWARSRPRFLVSVRVLSRLFRRLFLKALEQACRAGGLEFHDGVLASLSDPDAFRQYLEPLRRAEWVVYRKPPFGSAEQVIDYLGRYAHRVAIGEQRLLSQENGQVSFLYKDYGPADPQQARAMPLSAGEFIRRFLLHVLPDGFQRIRYYGLFGNR